MQNFYSKNFWPFIQAEISAISVPTNHINGFLNIMAIDIYTGPLTRYYAGTWENSLQIFCREQGLTYKAISPAGNSPETNQEEEAPSPQEIFEAVEIWIKNLSQAPDFAIGWEEGLERPYHTSQFSEFSAVYALSCYAEKAGTNLSKIWPEDLDLSEDPIIQEAEENEVFHFLTEVDLYLPNFLPGSGIFQIELPNERQVICSSTQKLIETLDALSKKIWSLSIDQLNSISQEETHKDLARGKDSLALAISGLCNLYEHALFSQKNKLPILLDS